MRHALAALALTIVAFAAPSAQAQQAPPECRQNAQGVVNFEACLAVAPPGSPWRSLSLMNLATQAFRAADYATAVRYYDAAQPGDGNLLYSDASYHAFYASTLHQVGRHAEARIQARHALGMLRNSADLPEAARRLAAVPVDREVVLAAIVPVLVSEQDPEAESAMSEYLALPATDWVSWVNRGSVMLEIGRFDSALIANSEAMRLEPSHPAVLSNQCYILVKLNRASEALPHCLAARAAAPEVAVVRHSAASAFAALGRCEEAQAELGEARRIDPVTQEYMQPLACTAN
jgi:Flp pilus assembly protein TadD